MSSYYPNMLSPQGWECPKCGSVYSPVTSKCFSCTKEIGVLTTTTNTTPIFNDNHLSLSRAYEELSEVESLFGHNSKHKAYIHIQKRMKELLKLIEQNGQHSKTY